MKNEDFIIQRVDVGNTVAIINRADYIGYHIAKGYI